MVARSVALTTTAALLALFFATPSASSHTDLVASSPEDGAELEHSPREVSLTFAEEVTSAGTAVVVEGPDGESYEDAASLVVEGAEISVDVRAATYAGTYQVRYRTVSTDGHILTGSVAYMLTGPSFERLKGSSTAPAALGHASSHGGGADVGHILILVLIAIAALLGISYTFASERRGRSDEEKAAARQF